MLVPNPAGGYHFLPGGEPYSSGVVADRGFEIVHVTLLSASPWREGFGRVDDFLRLEGRPRQALCGVELRSPAPFTRAGFLEFNKGYRELLDEWGLLVDGQNPVARTNVAPERHPPSEPSLHAFSYTSPSGPDAAKTFVVAGAGELRGGPLAEAAVVRPGDTSPEAMREKAAYVMSVMASRLEGLGAGWGEVTVVDLYTIRGMDAVIGPEILDRLGAAARAGVTWHHARPPIDELEFEMDLRGVRREFVL